MTASRNSYHKHHQTEKMLDREKPIKETGRRQYPLTVEQKGRGEQQPNILGQADE